MGLVGEAVLTDGGRVRNLKYISGMNIRISHEVKGAADRLLPWVYGEGRLMNTLILSPPGCGKTTILRDLVRQVSDGCYLVVFLFSRIHVKFHTLAL